MVQGDEDDDIGALGSILSWDEDEDGGGGNASQHSGAESSGLPDLVSFNLKDGGLHGALQRLQATGEGSNLNMPLPTPIDFSQQHVTNLSPDVVPQHKPEQLQSENMKLPVPNSGPSNSQDKSISTQQHQLEQQLRHHLQQQQQHYQQQQAVQGSQQRLIPPAVTQGNHNPPPQQQGVSQASAAQQQAQAQSAQQSAVAQGAFQLFQQNAMLAQQQQQHQQQQSQNAQQPQNAVHGMMMPNMAQGQEQAQQFTAFGADPAAFLRQLQVAQLQQHFNAVQQGRSFMPQVSVPQNQGSQAIQQQMQFQSAIAPAPAGRSAPLAVEPQKRPRGGSKKKSLPKPTLTQSSSLASTKAPLVSASDTDGESKHVSKLSRTMSISSDLDDKMSKCDLDLSHLSPEEKAKVNRDRNREHARNTRLRKKVYLEKLKSTVDELCRERDTLVSERAGAANILVEMQTTRTEVLMSFFALRSANEKRRELWASILDESCFACVMPVTPYRSFPASEVQVSKCQRTILGIDGMMSDTASLHVLLNSLVDRSRFPSATIVFRYTLVTEEAVVAGNQMMARWVMSTLNATQCGARMEVAKQGMLCCKFNSAHKIIGLELMFDVMALMLQLKQAAGSDTFSVIPNTVQTCQRSFDKPMVMMLAEEPYTIVQVNRLWEDMTGYKAEEVVGKASVRILEGEETEASAVEGLMNEIRFKRPASAMVVRYNKSGQRYRDFFLAYPLSTDSRITHYLALSSHIDSSPSNDSSIQQNTQGISQAQGSVTGIDQMPAQVNAAHSSSVYFGMTTTGAMGQAMLAPGTHPMFNAQTNLSDPLAVSQATFSSLGGGISGAKRPSSSIDGGKPLKQSKPFAN